MFRNTLVVRGLVIFFICGLLMSFSISASEAGGKAFTTYRDIGQIALPVAALLMTAVKADKQGALQFAEAFAATEAVTYGLKYAIAERRPDGGTHSFPSGHTSAAFAGTSFIQQRYGWDWGIPADVAATAVGISRITFTMSSQEQESALVPI